MQYTSKDYEFLGKEVVAGRYVGKSVFLLSLALALLTGICVGRYLFPDNSESSAVQKRPLGSGSAVAEATNPNKQLFQAILQHEEDVRKNPQNAEAWQHLGNLYFDAKDPAKSVNAYLKALELAPGNTSVLVDCGVMYRELQQYDKALEFFGKALEIDPKHEYALFNSGIVLYHDLGRKDEALASWRVLVGINPNAKGPSGELVSDMIKKH